MSATAPCPRTPTAYVIPSARDQVSHHVHVQHANCSPMPFYSCGRFYTTHNKHQKRPSLPPKRFEPSIPAVKGLQTCSHSRAIVPFCSCTGGSTLRTARMVAKSSTDVLHPTGRIQRCDIVEACGLPEWSGRKYNQVHHRYIAPIPEYKSTPTCFG